MSQTVFFLWTLLFLNLPMGPTDPMAPPSPTVTADVPTADPGPFSPGLSPIAVRFGEESVPYRVMAVFALPGEEIPVTLEGDSANRIEAEAGDLTPDGPGRWLWRAPAVPGNTTLHVRAESGEELATLNAFVMVPYDAMRNGRVDGYVIGTYPMPRAAHAWEARPRGFVEVTAANAGIEVSPHFTLGQFVCKSGADLPKYLVLQAPLLLRLESLLARVNEAGIHASTFHVMSAYRTPLYNRAIGNPTSFTRHQYGDAADIFVDESPADGRMDDLDGDGRFDRGDAKVLAAYAQELEGRPEAGGVPGGLSDYAPNHEHGAFVHVDTRGYAARW